MNISENILKHNLKNVYFLIGCPCGGKTTMCHALAQKYGFTFYNTNHREGVFDAWKSICDECFQPISSQRTTDWDAFFNRSTEDYIEWLDNVTAEHFEYVILELIKQSQHGPVVTDVDVPIYLLLQITSPDRIACMLTSPELTARDYYQRPDHSDIYECIMSLRNPEQALENNMAVLRSYCQLAIDEAKQSGLFCIMRDEHSTVEKSLLALEQHFGLK